ncbi:uncharacterized protein LOC107762232 isoform X3 [Nicotiana tabacum]|uniref:Uncharacterized protein LOC107762232 isoform X3 n=1 Tax=Nicotiana tabacum TaxID=4097 RepID=A0A1S3X860_TOBAC|nr:PREDICTED: uncharacterized protein LOC107762232 isoform X2 [Nicotiana tabacum]
MNKCNKGIWISSLLHHSPSSPKRKRGRTQMPRVHGRKERKIIILNEYNQPVGPTIEVIKELGSFLSTLARSGTFCPLNVFNWRKLDTKDDMWKYIKETYDIPDEAKPWVFESVCSAWRKYKSQFKTTHFTTYENDELRMENRPVDIPKSHFKDLLKYWNSDPHKAEMERIQSTQESEDGSHSDDAFASVMGPEYPGRVRLYGRGVTKTVLKGEKGSLGSSDERMQQKMEKIEEKMQQRMHEKLNEQKDAMEQNITMNVITRLQRLNPDLQLDPYMLRFSAHSPVEASYAQKILVQLNSRPSAGSNNQGQYAPNVIHLLLFLLLFLPCLGFFFGSRQRGYEMPCFPFSLGSPYGCIIMSLYSYIDIYIICLLSLL